MQLITKESETKSRIDEIERIEYFTNSDNLTIYFNVSREINGERGDKIFDVQNVLKIPIEVIGENLQIIFQKALELRASQLNTLVENSLVIKEPDYKNFYSELLITELFAIARQKAEENLHINTAYTDFALALTNSITGNINPIALQICLNKMLKVLEPDIKTQQLEELDSLIEKNKLPITRNIISS